MQSHVRYISRYEHTRVCYRSTAHRNYLCLPLRAAAVWGWLRMVFHVRATGCARDRGKTTTSHTRASIDYDSGSLMLCTVCVLVRARAQRVRSCDENLWCTQTHEPHARMRSHRRRRVRGLADDRKRPKRTREASATSR